MLSLVYVSHLDVFRIFWKCGCYLIIVLKNLEIWSFVLLCFVFSLHWVKTVASFSFCQLILEKHRHPEMWKKNVVSSVKQLVPRYSVSCDASLNPLGKTHPSVSSSNHTQCVVFPSVLRVCHFLKPHHIFLTLQLK